MRHCRRATRAMSRSRRPFDCLRGYGFHTIFVTKCMMEAKLHPGLTAHVTGRNTHIHTYICTHDCAAKRRPAETQPSLQAMSMNLWRAHTRASCEIAALVEVKRRCSCEALPSSSGCLTGCPGHCSVAVQEANKRTA